MSTARAAKWVAAFEAAGGAVLFADGRLWLSTDTLEGSVLERMMQKLGDGECRRRLLADIRILAFQTRRA